MPHTQLDRIAYLQQPPTRFEIVQLASGLSSLTTGVIDAVIAALEIHEVAQEEGRQPPPAEVLHAVLGKLGPLATTVDNLNALVREMKNAGVDPEWDHRA